MVICEGVLMEKRTVVNYRYLAISTTWNGLIWIAYIVLVTKLQKGKPENKDLPLLKNDITGSELVSKIKIHSRKHNFVDERNFRYLRSKIT